MIAQARSAWPIASLRWATKVICLPESVILGRIAMKLAATSAQPASNSIRPDEKTCLAL